MEDKARMITRSAESVWGSGFLKNLSLDLQREFPNNTGLSYSNLKYARQWYTFYYTQVVELRNARPEFSQQAVGELGLPEVFTQLGWGHHIAILSNFRDTLPAAQSSLARHITDFLLELGNGFSYVGRQIELIMPSGKSYKLDMLFYHIKLHCYVVVELKVVAFEPEFIGKLNFYVSAVDELLKSESDNPTIGLLICKQKDDTVVEWAFRGLDRPLGVAEYENELKKLTESLPTAAQIKDAVCEENSMGAELDGE